MSKNGFLYYCIGKHGNNEFKDFQNRIVEIRIHEYNRRKRKPFGLLAPMGDAAKNPPAMPSVLLYEFYFVRKRNTEFHVSIDEKTHQPDGLPVPMDWTSMYFTRYSPQPFIATLNPAFDGV